MFRFNPHVIADTAFKQQRLPAWQPVMTAKTVIPTFFVLGAVCIPVGAVLFVTSQSVSDSFSFSDVTEECINSVLSYRRSAM